MELVSSKEEHDVTQERLQIEKRIKRDLKGETLRLIKDNGYIK